MQQYMHADDLRTTAGLKDSISKQARVINNFARNTHLKLNTSKLEVVRILSQQAKYSETLDIANAQVSAAPAAKCLGVWWQYNLSASHTVEENISKARKAFFYLWQHRCLPWYPQPLI